MSTTQKEQWTSTSGDERTDKFPIVDISCYACSSRLAKVSEYRYVHLEGYDRMAVMDCLNGTVTVKCKCGVGRVIHPKGGATQGEKEDLGVWLKETDEGNSGKRKDSDQGNSQAD